MLSERMLTTVVKHLAKTELALKPTTETMMPAPEPGRKYMLYMHVPFCQRLCPYCSFNRYAFREDVARPYFANMRKEMLMVRDLGYDIESIYMGGGTPTIMLDELCETLDLARDIWDIKEVASETNPNHLVQPYLDALKGRIQRLSVGVQSFNNDLLKQMDRYEKYGSGEEIYERIGQAIPYFDSLNVDMIFNFPSQTEDILFDDLEKIATCGARQTTFSPLYVSHATMRKMTNTLGKMDYPREYRYYQILDGVLAGGENPMFHRTTLWTFTRNGVDDARGAAGGNAAGAEGATGAHGAANSGTAVGNVSLNAARGAHGVGASGAATSSGGVGGAATPQIDEFQTFYDQYPAIGSGSITYLNRSLYVNTFSLKEYNEAIESGRMSLMGRSDMSERDLMRYCFLVNLYKLRLDKHAFKREFGVSIERGLPVELAFMRLNGAFATDTPDELTLTPRGRYLVVVMYRQFLSAMNNLREQARAALSGPERELLFGDGTMR